MGSLKNIFLSAVFVVVATMATGGVAAVATLVMSRETLGADDNFVLYGAYAAVMLAAVVGFFFSVIPLTVAAVTMPIAIGVMRGFRLPRPLFDMLGGAAAALLCAAAAAAMLESLSRAKGGGPIEGDMRLILDICALFGGGALGYVRHKVLAPKSEPAEPQLAY